MEFLHFLNDVRDDDSVIKAVNRGAVTPEVGEEHFKLAELLEFCEGAIIIRFALGVTHVEGLGVITKGVGKVGLASVKGHAAFVGGGEDGVAVGVVAHFE